MSTDKDKRAADGHGAPSGAEQADLPGADASVDKGRRRLAQAGLTTPVIMTLFNRPVWAQTACDSLTASKAESKGITCEVGCTPGFWCQNPVRFEEKTGVSPHTAFSTIFTCSEDPFSGATLAEVVCGDAEINEDVIADCGKNKGQQKQCGNILRQLGRHAVAAWANASAAEAPFTFPLLPAEVVTGFCNAVFMPNSGEEMKERMEIQKDEFESLNERDCPFPADQGT